MKDTLLQEKSSPRAESATTTSRKARKITADYLYHSGLFYLERFPSSVAHFRDVMRRKIYRSLRDHPDTQLAACQNLLETVIGKLTALGLLDDLSLARGLLYSYQQRGWAERRIFSTLRRKGLDEDTIRNAFAEARQDGGQTDLSAALRWIRRKRLGAFAIHPEVKPGRWLASLGRAGFDYETACKALSCSREDADSILDQD